MGFPRGVVLLLAFCTLTSSGPLHTAGADSPAPKLVLKDLQGQTRQLSDLRGQVVVLNFWATWCAPCVEELPRLVTLQREFNGRGVQVIGASADDDEARDLVAERARELELNFPVWLGATTGDMESFGLPGRLPGTVVLGRDGAILARHAGVVSDQWLEDRVSAVIAGRTMAAASPAEDATAGSGARKRADAETAAEKNPKTDAATVPS